MGSDPRGVKARIGIQLQASAFFDVKKLAAFNGEYIRSLSVDEFIGACQPGEFGIGFAAARQLQQGADARRQRRAPVQQVGVLGGRAMERQRQGDDAGRIALSKKVSVVEDPAITARGSNYRHMVRVEVQLKNGLRLEQTVEAPRGSEQSFASEADIVRKFKTLATHTVSAAKADAIVNSVLGADKLGRADQIAEALAR